MTTNMKHPIPSERGFTLLLAAIVASVVLVLGSSIFSIAQKQLTLSSVGRDSQFAFYAADSAAECALYHDRRKSAFGTADVPVVATVVCDKDETGADLSVSSVIVASSGTSATSTFEMDLFSRDVIADSANPTRNCVQVTVSKHSSAPFTVIHADGYSTACAAINTSARTLQRSVELRY